MNGLDSSPLDLLQARTTILSSLTTVGSEFVTLDKACSRILREEIKALHTSPPANMSTMDGYAVGKNDTPCWKVIAKIPAGTDYSTPLQKEQALRVFTGSQLPCGVYSVIPQEKVKVNDCLLESPSMPSENDCMLTAGTDFTEGQTIFSPNRVLTARDIALIACLGINRIKVSSLVRVSIVSTGSELVLPGNPIKSGQIYASNGFAIKAIIDALGGDALLIDPVLDDRSVLSRKLEEALENSDLLVTIGGASVGDYDLVKPVLLDLGCQLKFVRVNTRPGRPIFFAIDKSSNTPILGLPGNPASCMVGAWIYLADMIKLMSNRDISNQLKTLKLISSSHIPRGGIFDTFFRAKLDQKSELSYIDSKTTVSLLSRQESGLSLPFSRADGLVLHRAFADEVNAFDSVHFLPPPHPML